MQTTPYDSPGTLVGWWCPFLLKFVLKVKVTQPLSNTTVRGSKKCSISNVLHQLTTEEGTLLSSASIWVRLLWYVVLWRAVEHSAQAWSKTQWRHSFDPTSPTLLQGRGVKGQGFRGERSRRAQSSVADSVECMCSKDRTPSSASATGEWAPTYWMSTACHSVLSTHLIYILYYSYRLEELIL